MNTCIIIPIIVGLLCALLGYLLGRLFSKKTGDNDCSEWISKYDKLKAEYDALKASKNMAAAPLAATAALIPFDAAKAKSAFGKRIKENDLKIVEGIGPKIEDLFHADGIKTWKDLSKSQASHLKSILDAAGSRYKMHNPTSWPKQAKMAYEGLWDALKKWQDEHKGGKE